MTGSCSSMPFLKAGVSFYFYFKISHPYKKGAGSLV